MMFCVSSTFCLWSLVILCRLFIRTDNINHKNYQSYADSFYWTVINFTVIGFSLLVWGFFHRYLLSLGCLLLSSWPYIDKSFRPHEKHTQIVLSFWCVSCCCLAIFPLLPVIGSNMYPTIVFMSGLILTPIGIITLRFVSNSQNHLYMLLGYFFGFVICLSSFAVYAMSFPMVRTGSLKTIIHIYSWSVIILLPLSVILIIPTQLGPRVVGWTVVYLVPLILMSTLYPFLLNYNFRKITFFAVFAVVTYLWLYIEVKKRTSLLKHDNIRLWDIETSTDNTYSNIQNQFAFCENLLTLRNFRQSLFFRIYYIRIQQIFFLTISFFGTGNIASINSSNKPIYSDHFSFDPRSTFCFTTILNPALMAILLLIKVICPMLFLGVIYAVIQLCNDSLFDYSSFVKYINNRKSKRGHDSILAHTGLTAVLSNLIAIHFFLWLRDEGSWLDIGTSISHYVIAMSISLAAFLFALLGKKMLSIQMGTKIHQALLKVSNNYFVPLHLYIQSYFYSRLKYILRYIRYDIATFTQINSIIQQTNPDKCTYCSNRRICTCYLSVNRTLKPQSYYSKAF
ncbi:GPI ethanolamine phosphate transferase 1 [Schistosoma japonicum]|nr:GPI ethanolamine phosphate transferase 1 [Schistosoma japonicum]